MNKAINDLQAVLNSPDAGSALAFRVLEILHAGDNVTIIFNNVERMTPSFANAFVMTLLERFSSHEFSNRVEFTNVSDAVHAAITKSIERYERGIRLTSQAHRVHPA
jgi:hypothetical protein